MDWDHKRKRMDLPVSVSVRLGEVIYGGFLMLLLFLAMYLFSGCSTFSGRRGEGITAEEVIESVVEAAPIVVGNPTMPGVLTAVISVVAALAGAGLGASAGKAAIKKKVADGKVGRMGAKLVDKL